MATKGAATILLPLFSTPFSTHKQPPLSLPPPPHQVSTASVSKWRAQKRKARGACLGVMEQEEQRGATCRVGESRGVGKKRGDPVPVQDKGSKEGGSHCAVTIQVGGCVFGRRDRAKRRARQCLLLLLHAGAKETARGARGGWYSIIIIALEDSWTGLGVLWESCVWARSWAQYQCPQLRTALQQHPFPHTQPLLIIFTRAWRPRRRGRSARRS